MAPSMPSMPSSIPASAPAPSRSSFAKGAAQAPPIQGEGYHDGQRLVFARLEMEFPGGIWLKEFSCAHPDLRIEVRNTMPLPSDRLVGVFDLLGAGKRDFTNEIRDLLGTKGEVQRFDRVEKPDLYRVIFPMPPHIAIAKECEVLFCYPRTIQNGMYRCQTVDSLDKVRELVRRLRVISPSVRIVGIRFKELGACSTRLTDAQRDLFRQALAAGYFEVPRKVSLGDLARLAGRSKSTVSSTLAEAEKRMAEAAAATGI